MKNRIKVIISGGGTGGHIFPAIAIANAIKKRFNDAEILFVGANGRMEMKRVPDACYKIVGLNISGLQRKITLKNILKNLIFPYKVLKSLYDAKKIVKEFKPDIAIGVGGYASGPTIRMAASLNIPTLIQEQNSYPGITNKMLAAKANTICVAYDNMERFFPKNKIVKTGNPVRADILNIQPKSIEGYKFFEFNPNLKTIVVIGGSLGSKTINQSIEVSIPEFIKNNIQVIWQTGEFYYKNMINNVEYLSKKGIKVVPFINRMDYLYSIADLVVSRAGALSISEICCLGKTSILIPSPNVSEDHQTKNAMVLANSNAAVMISDNEANTKLTNIAIDLINNELKLKEIGINAKKLALFNSDELIVDEITKLLKL